MEKTVSEIVLAILPRIGSESIAASMVSMIPKNGKFLTKSTYLSSFWANM